MEIGFHGKWADHRGGEARDLICEKCSKRYNIPDGYECHETDFGTVVIKAYTTELRPDEAHRKCKSDASYLHLPIPENAAQDAWFLNYSKKKDLRDYWLGINDADIQGTWMTTEGQRQKYFNQGSPEVTTFFNFSFKKYVKTFYGLIWPIFS